VTGATLLLPSAQAAAATQSSEPDSVLFEKKPPGRNARPGEGRGNRHDSRGPRKPGGRRHESSRDHHRANGAPPPREYTEEQIEEFFNAHEELSELRPPSAKSDREPRRRHRFMRRHIMDIMAAYEEGDTKRADKLVAAAHNMREISKVLRKLRRIEGERDTVVQELTKLVKDQVEIEHQLTALQLDRLETRLKQQRERHADDAARLETIAEERVQKLLKRRSRPGKRRPPRDQRQDP
jgi:chromosome segregation ATPase